MSLKTKPAMFDCEQIFKHANPAFYRKHPVISAAIILFFRTLWKESAYKEFHQQHIDKKGVDLIEAGLDHLNFTKAFADGDAEKIPRTGSFIIVANHPNMFDGVCLVSEIYKIRKDVKMVALEALKTIPAVEPYIIPVNNYDEKVTTEAVNEIKRYLKEEAGVVMFFPAGRLSDIKCGDVEDYPWGKGFYRIALESDTPIIPVYIELAKRHHFFWLSKVLFPYCYFNQSLTFHVGEMINAAEMEKSYSAQQQSVEAIKDRLYSMRQKKI